MAFEVTKVYEEKYPALRFIGKRYTNDDRGEDGFGAQWGDWMANDRFTALKQGVGAAPYYEDTVGLMTMKGDMTGFTYWVGLFFNEGSFVPENYDFIDLPESAIGAGWVRGNLESGEIFGAPPHEAVCKVLDENGIGNFRNDIEGEGSDTYCFFERYNCPRFTVCDADGNVTLDYGNYIHGK